MLPSDQPEKVLVKCTDLSTNSVRILASSEPWKVICLHWNSVFSPVKWVRSNQLM